jgi:hypothetical protein
MTLSRIPSWCVVSLALAACVAKDPENLGELESSSSGASDSDPSTTSPSSTSVSSTTVETTTDEPSTTAEPTTDSESESTRGETESESESVSETQSETESESASETGEPACTDPELPEYFPAGCWDTQGGVQLLEQGCFEECAGPESPCETGRCILALVDPCPCADDPEACCDSCAGQQWLCLDEHALGACGLIAGRTFSSVEELECGLGPNGPELCNWTVAFGLDGAFTWMHSDVGEGGSYACADGEVVVVDGPMVDVAYDAVNDQLTWDGVVYQ